MSTKMIIKNFIKRKAERLKQERNNLAEDIEFWPSTSLGYVRRDLTIKLWELKINILESFIGDKDVRGN